MATQVARNKKCNKVQASWQDRQNYQRNSCSLRSRRKGGQPYVPLPIATMLDEKLIAKPDDKGLDMPEKPLLICEKDVVCH